MESDEGCSKYNRWKASCRRTWLQWRCCWRKRNSLQSWRWSLWMDSYRFGLCTIVFASLTQWNHQQPLTDQQPKTKQGVLAQYSKVNADQVVIRPANITPTQAAGITLAALTAYQALFDTIKLDADQTIFINGGSTAVGACAIQFAKFKGARVIATASAKNEEFVRKMGADEVCFQCWLLRDLSIHCVCPVHWLHKGTPGHISQR